MTRKDVTKERSMKMWIELDENQTRECLIKISDWSPVAQIQYESAENMLARMEADGYKTSSEQLLASRLKDFMLIIKSVGLA